MMINMNNKRIVVAILATVCIAFSQPSQAWLQRRHLSIANPTTSRRLPSQAEVVVGEPIADLPTLTIGRQRRRPATSHPATGLQQDTDDDNDDDNEKSSSSSFQLNGVHVAAWIALVTCAFSPLAVLPGSIGSDQDNAMLQAIIADPLNPGINSIFLALFNLFGPMPVILASLLLPQHTPGGTNKIPVGPFLIASSAIGYFAMGPYLALRAPPKTVQANDWFTRNIAENKVISWFLVVLCGLIYAPLPAAVLSPDAVTGFIQLLTTSRFATISTIDLTILYVATTKAIYDDYRLRVLVVKKGDDNDDTNTAAAAKVAIATAVVPYLGAAVYCALRPSLEQVDET